MGNYEKLTNECIQWIQDWFAVNGPESPAVIGISGGKDSTIVAKLCVEALGADRVIGVSIPDFNQDCDEAKVVAETIGIPLRCVPIGVVADELKASVYSSGKIVESGLNQAQQNLPPRLRMAVLYFVAQMVGGRVVGTCNLSENILGYFTKWGDGISDMEPIANLTVTEVRGIGDYLGLPHSLVWKVPDDGLPHSKPDEDKFGFTYEWMDNYLRFGIIGNNLEARDKLLDMYTRTRFKRDAINIPTFKPTARALAEALGNECCNTAPYVYLEDILS